MHTVNGPMPALIQATKQGDLSCLPPHRRAAVANNGQSRAADRRARRMDRENATLLCRLAEPQRSASARGRRWGISPLDQLWCRLRIRRLRYDGVFTPPSLGGSIDDPGTAGGVDWGAVSVDNARHLLFVPSFRMASVVRLVARDAAAEGAAFT